MAADNKIDLLNRMSTDLKKSIEIAKKNGGKLDTALDKNLMLEFTAIMGLDTYKNNPDTFNSFPDEEYYPDVARIILEYFCYCINNKKEVPTELQEYLRDCFSKILKGGSTIEASMNLVGRKRKNPFLYPDYLDDITSDILGKGYSLTKACKEAQIRGVDKEVKYLMQQLKEYSIYCLNDWFLNQKVVNKIKFNNLYIDLTDKQKKSLNKYFDIEITKEGKVIDFKKTSSKKGRLKTFTNLNL